MRRIGVISAVILMAVVGLAQAEPPRTNVIAAEYAGITQTEDLRGQAIHDAVINGIHIKREHRRALRAHKKRVRAKQQAEALAAQQQQSTLISPTLGASLPQGGSTSGLGGIAQCESGGSPTAVSPDGQYRGKYQFDYGTWASVGGTGDPAAAPEAEQDQRAAQLHKERGNAPWPVCGN